jgi:hypothetical protein
VDDDSDGLHPRLQRLERLLGAFGSAHVAVTGGSGASLASPRLRPLTEEIQRRVGSHEWDVADALAVRILLDELTGSLRGCRAVAAATSAQLRDVHSALRDGDRLLAREAARQASERSTTGDGKPTEQNDAESH